MNDIILARVFGHSDIVEMADAANVPVINALSNMHHPLQALADYMILQESFQHDLRKLDVAWCARPSAGEGGPAVTLT